MTEKKIHMGLELALLVLLALLWGSSYLFIKIAVKTIPPVTLIAARVSGATVFLLLALAWKDIHLPKERRTWQMLFVQAIFRIGAWTTLAWGQQYVDSGLASVLNSTSPIFVFLITVIFTRDESTSALRLLGAGLGVVGVALIVGVDAIKGFGQQVIAQLAVLTGAMLYAGAAIHGKKLSHLPPVVSAAGSMTWATICLVPLSLAIDRPWSLQPSFQSVLAAIALAVLCTALALMIYFRLVRTIGSMGVASQSYLRAGVGVLLGVVILGEQITPAIGLGLIAVILSVAAINAPIRKARMTEESVTPAVISKQD